VVEHNERWGHLCRPVDNLAVRKQITVSKLIRPWLHSSQEVSGHGLALGISVNTTTALHRTPTRVYRAVSAVLPRQGCRHIRCVSLPAPERHAPAIGERRERAGRRGRLLRAGAGPREWGRRPRDMVRARPPAHARHVAHQDVRHRLRYRVPRGRRPARLGIVIASAGA